AAAHAGAHAARLQRRAPHRRRRADRRGLRRPGRVRTVVGTRRRPRGAARRPGEDLPPVPARPDRRARRRRARPGHRQVHRRSPRRYRRGGGRPRRRGVFCDHHSDAGGSLNRILIAEDEARIASFVEKGLRGNGFVTAVVSDGPAAFDLAASGAFDLLILDIGLPLSDGFTVLRRLREARIGIPVIILTARDSVTDKVAGLEGGADDYIAKPFAFEELLARVRLRLRADRTPEVTVLRVGDLALDLRTRRAYVGDRAVDLSTR